MENALELKVVVLDDNVKAEDAIAQINLEENNNIEFELVSTTYDKVVADINAINELQVNRLETPTTTNNVFNISLKKLDRELKIKVIAYLLEKDDLIDSYAVLNLYHLVKGGNTFEDEFFADRSIYLTEFTEHFDLKSALKPEIKEFTKKLCMWYLSVLKSCDKIEADEKDMVLMPLVFQRMLYITDICTMSTLLNRIKGINIDDTKVVNNANSYLDSLCNRQMWKRFMVDMIEDGTISQVEINTENKEG